MVRPGGVVAVFDGDYASLTFGSSDARLGRGDGARAPVDDHEPPRVMRELPRLLPQAGLALVATQAHVYAEAGTGGFFLGLAETYAPLAASAGLVPAADVDAWLADQRRSAQDGTFFAACNYYAYVARRMTTGGSITRHASMDVGSLVASLAPDVPAAITVSRRGGIATVTAVPRRSTSHPARSVAMRR